MIQTDKDRPIHIIVNPHSGYGGGKLVLADVVSALREAGLDVVEYTTTAPEDATRYAREIAPAGSFGDGLGRRRHGQRGRQWACRDGRAGPSLPGRDGKSSGKRASSLAEPGRHPARIRYGHISACDVGRINGRNFMSIIGVGFDGEVVRRLASVRTGHISHLSYFWPIWRTFWEHDFPRMRITVDGEEIFDDFGLAFVGNISRYSVGLRICRDALYDDGLLDLVIFHCHQQGSLMLHAAWTLLRMHPLKGNVIYRRLRKARFETEKPVPTQVDGDVGPTTPVEVSVAPDRIRLLVPPPEGMKTIWPWKGGDFV